MHFIPCPFREKHSNGKFYDHFVVTDQRISCGIISSNYLKIFQDFISSAADIGLATLE